MPTKTLDRTYKTKSLAISAAHKALGADAIEGLDFLVRNTGAGWEFEAVAHGTVGERAEKLVETPPKPAPKGKPRASKPEPTPAVAKPRTPRGKPPAAAPAPKPEPVEAKVRPKAKITAGGDKVTKVVEMMSRPSGATVPAMSKATGWKPGSVLARLRVEVKHGRGLAVTKDTSGAEPVYRIGA